MVSRTKPLARKPSSSALAITLVLQVVDGEIGDKVSLIPAATPPNNNGLQLYAMYVYVCVSAVYSWRQAQEADAAVPEEEQKKGADQINMGRELGAGSFELLISATDFWAAPVRCRTDQKESMISPEFYFTAAKQGFWCNSNNIVFKFVFFLPNFTNLGSVYLLMFQLLVYFIKQNEFYKD